MWCSYPRPSCRHDVFGLLFFFLYFLETDAFVMLLSSSPELVISNLTCSLELIVIDLTRSLELVVFDLSCYLAFVASDLACSLELSPLTWLAATILLPSI